MRILTIVLAGALLATAAPTAQAADDPKTVDGVSARQMALSRRYVELMQGDQLEQLIRSMMEAQSASSDDFQAMSAEDRAFTLDLTTDVMTDVLPQMMDRLVPVYARTFTEQELEALVAFYDTELGGAIVAKTMTSLDEVNAAMLEVLPQAIEKMAARACARYGCDAGEMDALSGALDAEPQARSKK